VSALIGDQQASLLGQTAFEPGQAKCTFGTGSFLLMNTGTELVRSRSGLITTVAHAVEGTEPVYALEGSVAVAGTPSPVSTRRTGSPLPRASWWG
jgi:glycerol kinase